VTVSPRITLFAVPGSNPSLAVRLMLAHKGLQYRTVELPFAIHAPLVRALGFEHDTVPAIRLDGRRIQGSMVIARALDELVPEPALFPDDPARRRRVEEAERWGHDILQSPPRRIGWWVLLRDRRGYRRIIHELPMPRWMRLTGVPAAPLLLRLAARRNRVTDAAVRADLQQLPALLEQVDSWIDEGLLGAPDPNAADFQIAASLRMLMAVADLAPLFGDRPAALLARRLVSHYPERAASALPPAWLPRATGR
jgi:glutathione S-transferase